MTLHEALSQAITRVLSGPYALETNEVRYMRYDRVDGTVSGVELASGAYFWETLEDAARDIESGYTLVALI